MTPRLSELYAHTKGHDGKDDFLLDHLRDVAVMAKSFAEKFNSGSLAYWLGFLHDLGKTNPLFQSYLSAMEENRSHPKAPHAIWGAAFIYDVLWNKNKKEAWNLHSRKFIPMMAPRLPRTQRAPSASSSFHQCGVFVQVAQNVL